MWRPVLPLPVIIPFAPDTPDRRISADDHVVAMFSAKTRRFQGSRASPGYDSVCRVYCCKHLHRLPRGIHIMDPEDLHPTSHPCCEEANCSRIQS